MNIKIRKPKKTEYDQVVKVVNSEENLYTRVFNREELDQIGIGDFNISDLKNNNTRDHLVAVMEDKIVGFISWYIKSNNIAWISMLEVDINNQHKGIGTKLIKKVEQQAKQLKIKAIALETQEKAEWAINFYKLNGYKILSNSDLSKGLYKGTLSKRPVKSTYIFGKML